MSIRRNNMKRAMKKGRKFIRERKKVKRLKGTLKLEVPNKCKKGNKKSKMGAREVHICLSRE
jgi:hypothetical protein